jgi:hypothetical protein
MTTVKSLAEAIQRRNYKMTLPQVRTPSSCVGRLLLDNATGSGAAKYCHRLGRCQILPLPNMQVAPHTGCTGS